MRAPRLRLLGRFESNTNQVSFLASNTAAGLFNYLPAVDNGWGGAIFCTPEVAQASTPPAPPARFLPLPLKLQRPYRCASDEGEFLITLLHAVPAYRSSR